MTAHLSPEGRDEPVFIERNRRGGDARCGTPTGAARHSRRGERPCDACAAAKAKYDADWRSTDENTKRNRLNAKAQALASGDLRRAHQDEYRRLYVEYRDALFAEHGLAARHKPRPRK